MQVAKKKIPERRCVGCGESFPKMSLIRIVRTPDGNTEIDMTGKKSGRGAYLCRSIECLNKARKAKRLERNLETSIDESVYATLSEELKRCAEID